MGVIAREQYNNGTILVSDINIYLHYCAPTATRTRDLLLRRHFRSVAGWCRMWPDVPVHYSGSGWMRLGVAQCL